MTTKQYFLWGFILIFLISLVTCMFEDAYAIKADKTPKTSVLWNNCTNASMGYVKWNDDKTEFELYPEIVIKRGKRIIDMDPGIYGVTVYNEYTDTILDYFEIKVYNKFMEVRWGCRP